MKEIKWYIGKEGVGNIRIDIPPYRAFFIHLDGDEFVDFVDFSESDLETKIASLKKDRKDTAPFEAAYKELANANSAQPNES